MDEQSNSEKNTQEKPQTILLKKVIQKNHLIKNRTQILILHLIQEKVLIQKIIPLRLYHKANQLQKKQNQKMKNQKKVNL